MMNDGKSPPTGTPVAKRPTTPSEPSALTRLLASVGAAAIVGLCAAWLDAWWAVRAEPAAGLASVALGLVGLMAPLAAVLGLGVGVFSLFMHPRMLRWSRLRHWVASQSEPRRRYLAVAVPASGLALVVLLFVAGRIALRGLISASPAGVFGATAALGVLLTASILCVLVHAAAAITSRRPGAGLDPGWSVAIGLGIVALGVGTLIAVGTTSGGPSSWALFGVFKRPELDLRAVALLAGVALGAYLGQSLLASRPIALLLVLGLMPLAATPLSAVAWLAERSVVVAVERAAPLGKRLLGVARRTGDSDKDGYSAWFGGGDCDDSNPEINPGADDIPENGRDEDCSGKDARRIVLDQPAAEPPKDAATWMREQLPEDPNVILITIDTLRYDLGYMGYERPVSPNIDELAKRSTIFERGYALASYTSKSLPPMLIGKYPSETHMDWSHFNRFSKEDQFVAERLQAAGIRTLSVQGYWYFFHEGYGFERGFDVVDSSAAPKVIQLEGDRSSNSDKISDAAIAQLSKPEYAKERFFAWIHYIDPHSEYAKHEGFDFGADSRARYDGEVAFVDEHVGRVLDFIGKSEFADRTVIMLTSDHGEAFGEHGMIRHGFEVWEELVRVPLIVHVPGAKGHRVEKRRGIIDIVPTILDVYGMPRPAGEDDFVSGVSLLPDVLVPPAHEPADRIVFVDMAAGPNNTERQAFIENDMKLITTGGRVLGLYDLAKDPDEKNDLSKDEALLEPILERFKAFRRELKTVKVKR